MLHFIELVGTANPVLGGHSVLQFTDEETKTHRGQRLAQIHQKH